MKIRPVLSQALRTENVWGNGGMAPHNINLCTIWPLYPQ